MNAVSVFEAVDTADVGVFAAAPIECLQVEEVPGFAPAALKPSHPEMRRHRQIICPPLQISRERLRLGAGTRPHQDHGTRHIPYLPYA